MSNSKIIVNWWDFYLLKWGVKKKAVLFFKTKPDTLSFVLDRRIISGRKTLIKTIFRLLEECRIEYYDDPKEMVIYDEKKEIKRRSRLDLMAIENIERLLNLRVKFEEYKTDFFALNISENIKFIVRKNSVSDLVVVNEIFLQKEYSVLSSYLRGATVLDIGSYIGDSAIEFISEGAKKVYSYEPHPDLYDVALKNIEFNNLDNKIILRNYGVGDKNETIEVYEDNFFGASACFGQKIKEGKEVKLKIIPLRKIIELTGVIDVMKMDCEGAEFKAILSCPVEYLRRINVMAIEYHDNPSILIEHLKRSGFEPRIIKQDGLAHMVSGLLFAIQKGKASQ